MVKKIALFVIVFALLFPLANLRIIRKYNAGAFPLQKSLAFDPYYRTDYSARIDEKQPAIVLLGDSSTRQFVEQVFSQELNQPVMLFAFPGTSSAHWHLFIRNAILGADHRPKMVFIFFRDTILTTPQYLVRGSYFIRLDEIATSQDTDVYEIAIDSQKSRLEKLFERYIPLYAYRSDIYFNLIMRMQNLLPGKITDCDDMCVRKALDQVFDEPKINDLLWEDMLFNQASLLMDETNLDFDQRVGESLLPMMMEELTRQDVTPVFVRLRFRQHAEGQPDSDELTAYLQDLRAYICSHGGTYVDLAGLNDLTSDFFSDNLHLSTERAAEASRLIGAYIRAEIESQME